MRGLTDSLAVNRAALEIASAHRRARISAILQSRVVELTISADALAIRPRGAAARHLARRGPGALKGVTLAGPSRVITFSPVGISIGLSNASFRPEPGRRQPHRRRVPPRAGAHRALSARPLGWLGG